MPSAWLTGLAVAALVSGCVLPGDPIGESAAVRKSSGHVEILFVRCGDYRVADIRVVVAVDPGKAVVPDDAPVVWHVVLDPSRALDSVVVGAPPAGAQQVVSLSDPLRDGDHYLVILTFAGGRVGLVGLRPAELNDGSVYYDGRHNTVAEFDQIATDCAGR